jgi:hypothetical protein
MFKIDKNNNLISSDFCISSKYINPLRDWVSIIFVSLMLVICSIIFDYFMYKKVSISDMYISIEQNELILEKLNKDDISQLLTDFNKRIEYISKSKIQKVIDPSM